MPPTPLTRRSFMALAATTAMTLALGGCSSLKKDEAPAEETDQETASEQEEQPAIQNGVSEALMAAFAYEGDTCNPINASTALFIAAGWHVFEGLYELDLHTYKAQPGLATDVPVQISELEYEITVRKDAMFSNGNPVTPADICYSFERMMNGDVYGGFLSFINSLSVSGAHAVRLHLTTPYTTMLEERLALIRVFPASSTDKELSKNPIGSGPWRYDSIKAQDGGKIVFKPNEYYTGSTPPTCERMEWHIMLDEEERSDALASQKVVCIEAPPEVNTSLIDGSGASIEYIPGFNAPFLMFNCLKKPFNDARVRQALLYAIDYDNLIAKHTQGHAAACTSLLPDYYRGYHRASNVYSLDQQKARALLTEAHAKNLSFTLYCNNNWVSEIAPSLVEDWKRIGVKAKIKNMSTERLFDRISTPPRGKRPLPFEVVLTPGDPSCFGNDPDLIINWWYGDNIWTRARSCWGTSHAFRQLKRLVNQAREEADETACQELWNDCFDLISEEVPIYPLFHRQVATAYFPERLYNYEPIGATGLNFVGTTPYEDMRTL